MADNWSYLDGRAAIDGVDEVAAQMNRRWGLDRLRLLVSQELRERFDRQRLKFAMAVHEGTLDDVRRESTRMINAWNALNCAAEAVGALKHAPRAACRSSSSRITRSKGAMPVRDRWPGPVRL